MSKLLSNIPVYDGSLFSWTRGVGFTEASTLSGALPFTKLYNDSHVVGFYVRSPKTRVEKLFVVEGVDWSSPGGADGDELAAWVLKSTDGFEIRVLND